MAALPLMAYLLTAPAGYTQSCERDQISCQFSQLPPGRRRAFHGDCGIHA